MLMAKEKTGAVLPRDLRRFFKAPDIGTGLDSRVVPLRTGALGALNLPAAYDMVVSGPSAAGDGVPGPKLRLSGYAVNHNPRSAC